MPAPPSGLVTILGSPGSLRGLEGRLASRGVPARRLPVIRQVPMPDAPPPPPLPKGHGRVLLLATSRVAADLYLLPQARDLQPWVRVAEAWGVGKATGERLRALGFPDARTPQGTGRQALLRALGDVRGATILYPRSDRAGTGLARELRRRGAHVLDLVAYRTEPGPPLGAGETAALLGASVLLATSPSALREARRRSPAAPFRRLTRTTRCVVLGARTARAARAHGFLHVEVPPDPSLEGLPDYLARGVDDALPG